MTSRDEAGEPSADEDPAREREMPRGEGGRRSEAEAAIRWRALQRGARRVPRPGPPHPGRLRELPQARRPEAAAAGERAKSGLVRELLPVVDNLERALASADDGEQHLAEGVRLVHSELIAVLERNGVQQFDPRGERFDPGRARGPVDARPRRAPSPGLVLDVVEKGYRANGTDPASGPSGRVRLGCQARQGSVQDARRRQEGLRRGDQEGLPQARPRVPPGPQPRRQGAPRSASRRSRRPTRSCPTPRSARRTTRAAGSSAAPAASTRAPSGGGNFGGFGDILSDLFGEPGRRRREPAPRARPRPRDRGPRLLRAGDGGRSGAGLGAAVGALPDLPAAPARSRAPRRRSARAARAAASRPSRQGLFSISQPCRQCGGTGTEIKDPCPTCEGSGRTRQVKRYRVNIPAGVRDGSRVRLAGKGEAGPRGGPEGDLYVITRVGESPIFSRKGDNLEVEVPITVPEAIRGATIEVPTLAGTKRIRVAPGTAHGTVQRLRGEGPPKLGGRGPRRHPLPAGDRRAELRSPRSSARRSTTSPR